MQLRIGAIADDFTGATDLASMLTRGGLVTILQLGQPDAADTCPPAEVVVVAMKSRTAPADQAIEESLQSWRWTASAGIRTCYLKYCSTFDSTPHGNIGPASEALVAETGARQAVYTPALPENGRTIYQGRLFASSARLSESGMQHPPLTPEKVADLSQRFHT